MEEMVRKVGECMSVTGKFEEMRAGFFIQHQQREGQVDARIMEVEGEMKKRMAKVTEEIGQEFKLGMRQYGLVMRQFVGEQVQKLKEDLILRVDEKLLSRGEKNGEGPSASEVKQVMRGVKDDCLMEVSRQVKEAFEGNKKYLGRMEGEIGACLIAINKKQEGVNGRVTEVERKGREGEERDKALFAKMEEVWLRQEQLALEVQKGGGSVGELRGQVGAELQGIKEYVVRQETELMKRQADMERKTMEKGGSTPTSSDSLLTE